MAVPWGMAGRMVEEAKSEGSRATTVREAIALAGEIVSESQIAVQAQKETVNVGTFLWLVFLL